eukprot:CAMPEP_0178916450 /NCGR_PEP_ID=MMETSP0786-20121207/12649_1 /TAXON_ID=186022 /ORGANISM="Thalassionema frauenfeldii, Strain CCMP 1798" /LENGTH=495 /DNA_ID=CAMNT_0020589793 /DNA_START=125 /DNA_END=1612 /DNA_ORIENTATION=-
MITLASAIYWFWYIGLTTNEKLVRESSDRERVFTPKNSRERKWRYQKDAGPSVASQEPMTIDEVTNFLSHWIKQLHQILTNDDNLQNSESMWKAYHKLTQKELVPWDRQYIRRLPIPRNDDSIFLSIATYRDENCFNTLSWAFGNSSHPDRLFVGLVQQNCYSDCRSGVISGKGTIEVPPDDDCPELFCQKHPEYCSQIRPLRLKETESLGPYGARFLASKLYGGEQWYMQIDAHMTFLNKWDEITVRSLHKAPSKKPVVSHYPPGHTMDLAEHWAVRPAGRLCGPIFSKPDGAMIRMEGLKKWDKIKIPIPRFAPFAAAGFLIGTAQLLKEVPFDPFLPWIFMGEEIIMSARLWTSGYDLFSPAQAVVGHIYVRKNKPKFWESMHRYFRKAGHDDLEALILLRVKHQLGYPEASRDLVKHSSLIDHLSTYGIGYNRTLDDYMKYAGIDVIRKEIYQTHYCEEHLMPPGKDHLAKLYDDAEREARKNATLVEKGA